MTKSTNAGDPHFWLDPSLVITYVENIRDGLTTADPEGAEVYKANADAYIAQLKELDSWIKSQVETIPSEKRLLVTNHENLGYFADRYGFTIVGTVIPSLSSEASPSAQEMAALVEQIKCQRRNRDISRCRRQPGSRQANCQGGRRGGDHRIAPGITDRSRWTGADLHRHDEVQYGPHR